LVLGGAWIDVEVALLLQNVAAARRCRRCTPRANQSNGSKKRSHWLAWAQRVGRGTVPGSWRVRWGTYPLNRPPSTRPPRAWHRCLCQHNRALDWLDLIADGRERARWHPCSRRAGPASSSQLENFFRLRPRATDGDWEATAPHTTGSIPPTTVLDRAECAGSLEVASIREEEGLTDPKRGSVLRAVPPHHGHHPYHSHHIYTIITDLSP